MPYHATNRYIRKTNRGSKKQHELSDQKYVARYLRTNLPFAPFISDWAAGAYLTPFQASQRKSLQSGRGFPDMMVLYPSRGYHGLAIELKTDTVSIYVSQGPRKGQLVKNEQIATEADMLKRLNDLGYCARFACGRDKAIQLIEWYFDIPQNAELF